MQLIYNAGDPLDYRADYCLGEEDCPTVRRVSLCKTMLQAYTQAFMRMDATPDPTTIDELEYCAGLSYSGTMTANTAIESEFENTANQRNFWYVGKKIETPFQDNHDDTMLNPWVYPQPSGIGCPDCLISLSEKTLYIRTIHDDSFFPPEEATLSLGGVSYSFLLPEETDTLGLFIENVPVYHLEGGGEAIISIPVNDSITTTTPLAIVQ